MLMQPDSPLSSQLLLVSDILARIRACHVVTTHQRDELVDLLAQDLSDGVRRLATIAHRQEAELAALRRARPSAKIVDLSEILGREVRERRSGILTVIDGGAP